jgi:hypothetical protein
VDKVVQVCLFASIKRALVTVLLLQTFQVRDRQHKSLHIIAVAVAAAVHIIITAAADNDDYNEGNLLSRLSVYFLHKFDDRKLASLYCRQNINPFENHLKKESTITSMYKQQNGVQSFTHCNF